MGRSGRREAVAALDARVADLNQQEKARRVVVNARHYEKYGRVLYPQGGQFERFALEKGRVVGTNEHGERRVVA